MPADVMLLPGLRLGDRYRLQSRIGAGGMGEVWLAVDEVLGRTVAVKVMLPAVADEPGFAARFAAEATAMARVNHPAVASIHDFGRSRGVMFLVMEYVDGESLAQRLARTGRLGPDETMRLVAHAAAGLQAVHDQQLVHRDIKPANLLVRRDGAVVITDFGIARHENDSRLTVSGAVLGTPSYLSPEQVRGLPAGLHSDIYSLGLVAYECLAGERPFVGDNPYAVALQRLESAPRTIGVALPGPVLAVVQRALAAEPDGRWPSAAAMADAARAAADSSPAPPPDPDTAAAPPPSHGPVAGAATRRHGLMLLAVLAVLLLAGGAAALAVRGDDSKAGAASGIVEGLVPDGFVSCGSFSCPAEPMCWGGLTSISGTFMPPARRDCAGVHEWETFLAFPMPAGGVTISAESSLMEHADIATTCSAAAMTARSREPQTTRTWVRDVWPVPTATGSLLHCLARSPGGRSAGAAFRPGA